MAQGALVTEKIEAGAGFLKRFGKFAPIEAAFWLKADEDDFWKLNVWSYEITDANFDLAYGEVLRLARAIANPNFDPFEVTLLRGGTELAQAAIDIHKQYPAKTAAHFQNRVFGGKTVAEVYVYPPFDAHRRATRSRTTSNG